MLGKAALDAVVYSRLDATPALALPVSDAHPPPMKHVREVVLGAWGDTQAQIHKGT